MSPEDQLCAIYQVLADTWPDADPVGAVEGVRALAEQLEMAQAKWAAEALRDAAAVFTADDDVALNAMLGGPSYITYWLLAHADRIESGHDGEGGAK